MNFEVFDALDSGWTDGLSHIPAKNSDINFLPQWYLSWQKHEQATPKCIVAEIDGYYFVYPFFMHQIKEYSLHNNYYDVQSAYGYGGVITSSCDIPESVAAQFNRAVDKWFEEQNVVAEFIREHPLLNHFRRDASYFPVRRNVYVPTAPGYTIPDKQARQNIAKALKNDLKIFVDNKMDHIDEFIRLYELTAERLNMDAYYLFDKEYFYSVKNLLSDHALLIHIVFEDKIVASNLFMHYGDKGTMHLAGSDISYQSYRINDLLYQGAINQSISMGKSILTIGGGTSTREDDSLFRFKSKYSNIYKDVMAGKKVHNHEIYHELIRQWSIRYPELVDKYKHFFLKYRQTC
ncbi:MAG: GNAT family N-acetyltransferase [Lentimicrobium sp.]|nr:GNAT family N-acetyltransferase [Lentimicrobium sp.]